MDKLVTLILIITLMISAYVFAHSGGHGKIDAVRAIELAKTSAQKLTFNGQGMSAGKIDDSWNKDTKGQFELSLEDNNGFVISAVNPSINQTLYFKISKDGEIKDVYEAGDFSKDHGHQH